MAARLPLAEPTWPIKNLLLCARRYHLPILNPEPLRKSHSPLCYSSSTLEPSQVLPKPIIVRRRFSFAAVQQRLEVAVEDTHPFGKAAVL